MLAGINANLTKGYNMTQEEYAALLKKSKWAVHKFKGKRILERIAIKQKNNTKVKKKTRTRTPKQSTCTWDLQELIDLFKPYVPQTTTFTINDTVKKRRTRKQTTEVRVSRRYDVQELRELLRSIHSEIEERRRNATMKRQKVKGNPQTMEHILTTLITSFNLSSTFPINNVTVERKKQKRKTTQADVNIQLHRVTTETRMVHRMKSSKTQIEKYDLDKITTPFSGYLPKTKPAFRKNNASTRKKKRKIQETF